ncbi:putative polysaccharide biosynthesis protein [Alkalicoccus daliensis]|uniref:Membrane protein involved in the export of O-antigen and teichoic acid n=1 Tax=Alkalicoccus daliensis TaxID=745820 RepID=A0A1H0H1C3_9BACI|nr:polysaccharide biosynthesis protein [Alkalicoccus daliensis]SDO13066.1 Membrane protein involved in the export of O-antigen and teichoic acid [Alkalicoccus daliensis]
MSDQQLLRGTMVLTAGIFITKMLGLIYIFPFTAIVGHQGLALYQYGYTPYTVLLSLATLGVPLAVSKFVSKYNALGDYHTGQRLLKSGLIIMTITGFIAFLVLFFSAEMIANRVLEPDSLEGNRVEDAVFTIRMVSVALLVVPVMAIIRGFFQGNQSMGPTAVSQVIEQVIRIAFILAVTYMIMYIFDGELGTAVGFATFGAFAGALGGLAVLLWYWKKRLAGIKEQVRLSTVDHKIPLPAMYKELFRYALPLSFVGLAIPLYQTVDLWTFNPSMREAGYITSVAETYYASFTQSTHKLILIPVSIATAMSLTILPTITEAFTNKENDKLQRTITQTYQIILFLTIPAAAGLIAVAGPVYGTLFGLEEIEIGREILRTYAPVAVLFSIFAVTASLLQGIDKQKYAVLALIAGVTFKVVTNSVFIQWFGPQGGVFATTGGYILSVAVNVWAIGRFAEFDYRLIRKRLMQVLVFTAIMAAVVVYVAFGLERMFPLDSRMNAAIVLTTSVGAGVIVYMNIAIRSGLAGKVLGHRFSMLKKE